MMKVLRSFKRNRIKNKNKKFIRSKKLMVYRFY